MEIINTGSYLSWSLPKYTNIVLTSNPDSGEYNVTSLDPAVKSRLITLNGRFDIKEWARWAEFAGIDGRAVNFAMLYPSELFEKKNNVVLANARSYTTFCRAIAGLKDWSDEQSLSMIMQIASGCFFGNDNTLGALFTQFIHNRLDRLVSPEEMATGSWNTVQPKIYNCVYEHGEYRADIASILGTRFLNWADKSMQDKTVKPDMICKRLSEFQTSDPKLFTQDILYTIVRTLAGNHPVTTTKWFYDKNIKAIAL